jgi:hypothetical protein
MRTLDLIPTFEVRHGESEQNIDKEAFRNADPDTIQCTDEGHAQGLRAGIFLNNYLMRHGLTRVRMMVSPLPRAASTADNILRSLAPGIKVDVDVLDALRETRFLPRRPDGLLVPAPDGDNVFGRGLVDETRNQWFQRLKTITHATEDAAISGRFDAVVNVGHESTTRFWTAIEYLEKTLEQADGFHEMGNAHIWKCHENRVQAIYPGPALIARRTSPVQAVRDVVQTAPAKFHPN